MKNYYKPCTLTLKLAQQFIILFGIIIIAVYLLSIIINVLYLFYALRFIETFWS